MAGSGIKREAGKERCMKGDRQSGVRQARTDVGEEIGRQELGRPGQIQERRLAGRS